MKGWAFKMNKLHVFQSIPTAVALVVAMVATYAIVHTPSGAANATNPGPRTLVVDQHALIEQSKLGQDIRRQVMAYEDSLNAQYGTRGQALQKELQMLQQQTSGMQAAERDKKMQALQAKEDAYQQEVGEKQNLVKGGQLVAIDRFKTELNAVLHAIMVEHGADVVVYKSSIAASLDNADITREAVQQLDRRMSTIKVPLVKPPANVTMIH